jgi:hypothetical protein
MFLSKRPSISQISRNLGLGSVFDAAPPMLPNALPFMTPHGKTPPAQVIA